MADVATVRATLIALLGPLYEEREQLSKRVEEIEAELSESKQAVRDIDAVIGRLSGEARPGPKPKKAEGTPKLPTKISEERIKEVRDFIEAHPDEIGDDFTGSTLARAFNENGQNLSRSSVNVAIGVLYERGVLHRARRVQGGYAYALTREVANT